MATTERAAMPPRLLTQEQAAQVLNISERMVRYLIASRDLQAVKIGRRTLVPCEAIESLIAERTRAGMAS